MSTDRDLTREIPADSGSGNRQEIDRRLQFLDLTNDDQAWMRRLAPIYERHADAFVEAFYEHLFAFEETAAFLQDPQLVERLKRAQREHFRTMLEANWTSQYVVDRHQIGHVHAEVGIEPQWFLGAYNQYIQFCFRRFAEAMSDGQASDARETIEPLLAVLKAIFLDVGLTLDAYFAQSTQKLRHALDMLWKANVELKHFAQLASHDLKTPLATVANLCDEALDEFGPKMPSGARELIDAAKKRTYRMSEMIDELLSSHLAEAGDATNDSVASEVPLLEALERIRPVLESRRIELKLPKHYPLVWGNRVRLREAFYNLLSNAAKFVEAGKGRIELSVVTRPDGHLFTIADNGPGIPSDELERIFMPFRRLPQHRHLPGSGLGLYFAKTLIEHQEGRLWAESDPGRGSRLCVLLRFPQ